MQPEPETKRADLAGRHVALFWSLPGDIDPLFRILASQGCSGLTVFAERENEVCRAELVAHAWAVENLVLFHLDSKWRTSPDLIRQVLSTPSPDSVVSCQSETSSLNALQARLREAGYFSSEQVLSHQELGALPADRDSGSPTRWEEDSMGSKGRFFLGNLRSLTRRRDQRNPLRPIHTRDIFKTPDLDRLSRFLNGKTLSLYGGASSVGRALLDFFIAHEIPLGRVVVFNPPGNNLNLLKERFPKDDLPFELTCIEKSLFDERVYDGTDLLGPDEPIVVQMAGLKYHHHATRNPWEAFNLNTYATARVLDFVKSCKPAAGHAGCFLFTSSDKATDMMPINMLGLTRKLGEYYLQSRAASDEGPGIHVGITRFTHILNSTGSWLFHKLAIQQAYDRPFTLTDKRAYTSFIRLDEAVIQVVQTLHTLLVEPFVISVPTRVGKPVVIKDVIDYENERREHPATDLIGLREGEEIGAKDLKSRYSKAAFLNKYEKAEAERFHTEGCLSYSTRRAPIPREFMGRAISFLQHALPDIHEQREAGALIESVVRLVNAKFFFAGSMSRELEEVAIRIEDCSPDFHRSAR